MSKFYLFETLGVIENNDNFAMSSFYLFIIYYFRELNLFLDGYYTASIDFFTIYYLLINSFLKHLICKPGYFIKLKNISEFATFLTFANYYK